MAIKTLHITNSYHPASGGIRTFYQALLQSANRHRRHVRLVVPAAETSMEEVGEFGRIYHIAAPQAPVLDTRYRWLLPHTYTWNYHSPLRRILAAEKPDLVEVCDKFFLLYLAGVLRRGWIPGVPQPAIVGLSCERLDENMRTYVSSSKLAQFICKQYMRLCYVPRFDFHITASDYIAEELRPILRPQTQATLHVCPMGVDYESLSESRDARAMRANLLQRLGAPTENSILLLYAGRLSKEKNLQLLPPMLANLANDPHQRYCLIIAGEGPLHSDLRDACQASVPNRSLFLGHCERQHLLDLYHATDIFIHPNPREPFGLAPLEAMAAGLPLIAPNSGGVLSYANSQNAWLAENSPPAFAEAVRAICSDDTATRRKIESARATTTQFSWPLVTENYFQLYDHLHQRWMYARSGQRAPLIDPSTPPLSQNDPSKLFSA